MRLLRLRLANYRGIESCEVRFRRHGITVVAGPNEVGKTSLAEAIRLLFEHLDSTAHREVRSVKPVHRDAGPEIELEAESGPYAFVYSKRFLKKAQTTLTVSRPHPESLTGREAHDRASSILRDTIDVDLWRALLVAQGRGVDQADLSRQVALSAALDRAAGGSTSDPRGENLYDRVKEEAGRHFTEKGAEKKDLQQIREELATAEADAENLRGELENLDQDIGEAARFAVAIRGLDRRVLDLRERLTTHDRALAEIDSLVNTVEKARLRHESDAKSLEAAEREFTDRTRIEKAAEAAREILDRSTASCGALGPELGMAEDGVGGAEGVLREADRKRKEAETLAETRRYDFEYVRGLLDLDTLRERKERVDQARVVAASAREVLAGNPVDDRRLKAVEDAERVVATANARLDAGAPTLHLKAQAAVRLEIGGKRRTLKEGTETTMPIPDRARVVIPGSLELEVVAGSSLTNLQRKLEESQAALKEACRAANVAGVEEARKAHQQRQEAARAISRLKEVEKADLRDLSYEQIEGKVVGLAKHLPEYPKRRSAEAPRLPSDLDEARREDVAGRRLVEAARSAAEKAREEFERARDQRDKMRREAGDREAARRGAADASRRATGDLEEARRRAPDAGLETNCARAKEAARVSAQDFTAAREALAGREPERVRALATTDTGSLKAADRQLEETRREATEVRRRLDSSGEAGLHEKHETASAQREAARSRLDNLLRLASGARLLFETLRSYRDEVRRAYHGPLRDRVEALGRILFDGTFSVEVGEDLQILSRTLRAITVPFEDLSTGTKEQLSLIVRIACAMLLSEEGGPLLLDDVLGHTDPDRLAAMGAILRLGGERCQIVLLTSVPDRYAHVGDAEVVRLSQTAQRADGPPKP